MIQDKTERMQKQTMADYNSYEKLASLPALFVKHQKIDLSCSFLMYIAFLIHRSISLLSLSITFA